MRKILAVLLLSFAMCAHGTTVVRDNPKIVKPKKHKRANIAHGAEATVSFWW